jgi:hypothetical protein
LIGNPSEPEQTRVSESSVCRTASYLARREALGVILTRAYLIEHRVTRDEIERRAPNLEHHAALAAQHFSSLLRFLLDMRHAAFDIRYPN